MYLLRLRNAVEASVIILFKLTQFLPHFKELISKYYVKEYSKVECPEKCGKTIDF